MRKDEEQGKDYSFVTRDVFLKGIETVSEQANNITDSTKRCVHRVSS